MFGRILDSLAGLRADVRVLTRTVEVLLDRWSESETLTTAEACRFAGVSPSTLKSWRASGLVDGHGGRWRRRDLEVVLRARMLGALVAGSDSSSRSAADAA